MINHKWEAHLRHDTKVYDTLVEARAAIEAEGDGLLLSIVSEPNLPFCLPKVVWRTAAGWRFDAGVWYAVEMHGPGMGRWPEEPYE